MKPNPHLRKTTLHQTAENRKVPGFGAAGTTFDSNRKEAFPPKASPKREPEEK